MSARRWTEADLKTLDPRPLTQVATTAHALLRKRQTLESRYLQGLQLIGAAHLFEREARFHDTRKWRFDFLCRNLGIAIEIHGGTFAAGRHTRGRGFGEDRRKMNAAALMGITVLEFDGPMVRSGEAIRVTEDALSQAGWEGRA